REDHFSGGRPPPADDDGDAVKPLTIDSGKDRLACCAAWFPIVAEPIGGADTPGPAVVASRPVRVRRDEIPCRGFVRDGAGGCNETAFPDLLPGNGDAGEGASGSHSPRIDRTTC